MTQADQSIEERIEADPSLWKRLKKRLKKTFKLPPEHLSEPDRICAFEKCKKVIPKQVIKTRRRKYCCSICKKADWRRRCRDMRDFGIVRNTDAVPRLDASVLKKSVKPQSNPLPESRVDKSYTEILNEFPDNDVSPSRERNRPESNPYRSQSSTDKRGEL